MARAHSSVFVLAMQFGQPFPGADAVGRCWIADGPSYSAAIPGCSAPLTLQRRRKPLQRRVPQANIHLFDHLVSAPAAQAAPCDQVSDRPPTLNTVGSPLGSLRSPSAGSLLPIRPGVARDHCTRHLPPACCPGKWSCAVSLPAPVASSFRSAQLTDEWRRNTTLAQSTPRPRRKC